MREIVARWKYRGDYIIGKIFRHYIEETFTKSFRQAKQEYVIVPIPLSKERLKERKFNQSLQLCKFTTSTNILDVLRAYYNEKQAKKSRSERILTKNPFYLTKPINKSVILVDDIYTTGRTIRHAAELLHSKGAPAIYSLTLIRG